jgi:hypothetical protein
MTVPPGTSPRDVAWLERHENVKILVKITRPVLVPLLVAALGVYFKYRLDSVHARVDQNTVRQEAGWQTMAPVVKDLQGQMTTVQTQLQLMQQLLVFVARNGTGGGSPPATTLRPVARPPAVSPETKAHLLKAVETTKAFPTEQRPLPDRLADVPPNKAAK